jgi:cell wall-associated NlpC family hydrolase
MNRKKIAAMVLFGLTMTTCAEPANGIMYNNPKYQSNDVKISIANYAQEARIRQEKEDAIQAALDKLNADTEQMEKSLKRLNYYVGKTWYAFSGSGVRGWDCSGLVLWFYKQQGIELEHRASLQDDAGVATKEPKPGDIVVFKYKGYNSAYHVGIYIGNNEMIHAPRKGAVTRIEDIDQFGGDYSKISFRRLIDTN